MGIYQSHATVNTFVISKYNTSDVYSQIRLATHTFTSIIAQRYGLDNALLLRGDEIIPRTTCYAWWGVIKGELDDMKHV